MTTTPSERPASELEGLTLDGGWTVGARLGRGPDDSGGNFSVQYRVTSEDGRQAFLKALDYSRALTPGFDFTRTLEAMLAAYNYERELLDRCVRMSHVVTSLEYGEVRIEGRQLPVSYLIFEWADEGDSRRFINVSGLADGAWALRALHHAAVGLLQLHSRGIAHQDVKPSNVLVFSEQLAKLGDLGTSSYRGQTAPRDHFGFPGDPDYAPPEMLFGQIDPDWDRRRVATDLFQLGNLIAFFFIKVNLKDELLTRLDARFHPSTWTGTYDEALPFIRQVFNRSLQEVRDAAGGELGEELAQLVEMLCEPDPAVRGHPRNRAGAGRPYGLERIVTKLDLLARKAESGLLRGFGS